jgi:hypothetical protein
MNGRSPTTMYVDGRWAVFVSELSSERNSDIKTPKHLHSLLQNPIDDQYGFQI